MEQQQVKVTDDLEELCLNVRAWNCLKQCCKTVGDLVQMDANNLLRIKNFGRKSYTHVVEVLAEEGLSLAPTGAGVTPEGYIASKWIFRDARGHEIFTE